MPAKIFRFFFLFWFISGLNHQLFPQKNFLTAGPMLGYAEMREVQIWLQTKKAAELRIEYWEEPNDKQENVSGSHKFSTETIETFSNDAFTTKFTIGELTPGKKYYYDIFINRQKIQFSYPLSFKTQPLWQWRTDPPVIKFAIGSCVYINDSSYDRPIDFSKNPEGLPYGGEYSIFENIRKSNPDFMIWLGDNVYLREADWNSRSGIFYRYSHTRALSELQPLLASCNHYAIWDDHDYGPNNANRSYRNKNHTLEAFKLFWANPSNGVNEHDEGISTTFEWGDCHFFLLDNRTFRTANFRKYFVGCDKQTILGENQINELIDGLKSSKSTFNFIVLGGQFLNPAHKGETYNNIAAKEREEILEIIKKEKIPGVIFLTGDRHFTELSSLSDSTFYTLHDITISPLTSSPYPTAEFEENPLRIPGTFVGKRNYATIEIIGPKEARRLLINVLAADGSIYWSKIIEATDLIPSRNTK